jgi:hypothetical protein
METFPVGEGKTDMTVEKIDSGTFTIFAEDSSEDISRSVTLNISE